MKKVVALIITPIILCLFACQPTPEQEYVVNKGDGSFEELIKVTAAPQKEEDAVEVTENHLGELQDPADEITETGTLPATWEDLIETPNYRIVIDATIEANGHPYPIRKVQRYIIKPEEIEAIANEMLPSVNAVWNSTEISRQEYENALALLSAAGRTEEAKDVFELLQDNTIPIEQFQIISGLQITDSDYNQTIRYGNNQTATVNCRGDSLQINSRRHAIVHTSELLARDGHYEGQGPIHISPTISQTDAEALMYGFLKKVGLTGYQVSDFDTASYYGLVDETEYSQGWYFYLVNANEYIPVEMQRHGVGSIFQYNSKDSYCAPWLIESMCAYVSENGVEFFSWYNPTEMIELTNPDVQLLSFDELQIRIKNMLSAGLSWMANLEAPYGETPTVSRLVLTQTLVPVKNERTSAYLMPTWVVVTDWYGPTGVCSYTDYNCFNAVDGSPICLDPDID